MTVPTQPQLRPIPPGGRLLHVGPHKTGTTSVQSAFHLARRSAWAQGVRYAGADRHAVIPVQAAIQPSRATRWALRRWRGLAREMQVAPPRRAVLSSEWLADADDATIARIVDAVAGAAGREAVHVAVTVRSLERVLPSQWQQYVAAGLTTDFEPWLHDVLDAPDRPGGTPTFWGRHRHDRLVERWASVVGPANVTVIVVDDGDHGAVLRAFEVLLGLRDGTLVAEERRSNRSLTRPEAEQVLALNRLLVAEVPRSSVRLNVGLYGAAAALRDRLPRTGEPRIELPGWARRRAREIGSEIVGGLQATGAAVIGDLDRLVARGGGTTGRAADERATAGGDDASAEVRLEIAGTAAVGVLTTVGLARARRQGDAHRPARDLLQPLSTQRLGRVVIGRVRGGSVTSLRILQHGLRVRRRSQVPAVLHDPTTVTGRVLAAFEAAVAADGLPATVTRRVLRDGVHAELARRGTATETDPPIADVGAVLAMGVVRAAGLLPGQPGSLRTPPLSTVETQEIARVSTPVLALEVARRLAGAPRRRVRG